MSFTQQHFLQLFLFYGDESGLVLSLIPSSMSGALPCLDAAPVQRDLLIIRDAADRSITNLQNKNTNITSKKHNHVFNSSYIIVLNG